MSDAREELEARVRRCYSTWSETYADEYYGPDAPYPPVHVDILRGVIRESGARTILDAGCGPATFLRELVGEGLDLYGFDLTPEMVDEARRVLADAALPADRIWTGSVLDPAAFRPPGGGPDGFDAAVCIGVLPHVPAEADAQVIANLRDAVRPGGTVALEARNQLFALFTLNRYTYDFFVDELLTDRRGTPELEAALPELAERFRMDLPPVRRGKADEPGYDEILARTHNPLVLRETFADAGFRDVRVRFYHFHALPPMFESLAPEAFRQGSVALERPDDWRGYLMASAFILTGVRA